MPNIFYPMAVAFSLALILIPHVFSWYRIKTLQKEIAILQKILPKNDSQKEMPAFQKILQNSEMHKKIFFNLFSCITNSQIQWKRILFKNENIMLQGETSQFSQLQNFLIEARNKHLFFLIQKMEVMDVLHFQLMVDSQ